MTMTQQPPSVDSVRDALAACSSDALELEVYGSDVDAKALPSTGIRRRATRRGRPDPVQRASLYLNRHGVLEWHFAQAIPPQAIRGRRAAATEEGEIPDGELVDVFEYETLDANSVGAFLDKADARLNDRLKNAERMYRLSRPGPGAIPAAAAITAPLKGKKRRLLIVHGTFSKSGALLEGMGNAPGADAFFTWMFNTYDEVLAFEHPTLAVSPVLNALDLRRALAGIDGPLDIVAHSRGGLVTRWAVEAFGLPASQVRAMLVGSPLGGTSLASPPRLRATLGLLTNFGTALKAAGGLASAYVPFLVAPLAILKVATSVIGAVGKTPLIDGTIAMIPGLAGQSRVSNNPELTRLADLSSGGAAKYFVVASDFEPDSPGWKFWKWFKGKRIADAVTDKIFPGKNDLVVDTDSMTEIPDGVTRRRDFGTNALVHHTNYFEQQKTLDFIRECFGG
ncbi:MAG: hypothetical protein U0163_16870 [Gemmatimonadaceae bacterium]